MKEKIATFLAGLIQYDYMLFGAIFTLFILLIILALLLRKKMGLSIFLVFLSFTILFAGPTVGYLQMHNYLFKNSLKLISEKKLLFSDAIIVKGSITNDSQLDFQSCQIDVDIHRVSKNIVKNYLYQYKTIQQMSFVEENITIGDTRNFKVIVEPFTYSKEYNITLGAKCK